MGRRRQRKLTIIEVEAKTFDEAVRRMKAKRLCDEDYAVLTPVLEAYPDLINLLKDDETSIGRLRKMLFGACTEKTRIVIGEVADTSPSPQDEPAEPTADAPDAADKPPPRRKGHGRNAADAYRGAKKIKVPHESLWAGDPCPKCEEGSTLYDVREPGVLVRIVGQAPVQATVYKLQKLRCNLCGKVFMAKPPKGVGSEKYDATAAAMVGLLKYGSGLPFNRLAGLQRNLGIPLPASTQWDIVHDFAARITPAFEELIRQAAQGDVLHNDDTTVKILELMGKRAKQRALTEGPSDGPIGPERTGMFTSGIVSTREGRRIALFFTGRQHAGENLKDVLAQRAADLGPPIQMCDGLSRNLPGELKTILGNCLAHSRRKFVDIFAHFSNECRYVLEALEVVYKNDATARKGLLSPEERLSFHQSESGPIMGELHTWLTRQFDDRLVEPNSVLGEAITYMLNRWKQLTLFLRQAGAPLDNNIAERALKKVILHRKNALFFKTENGARVGDLFMSLIYTCEFCGANPFDYLTELQRHAGELSKNPQDWMPWDYRSTLEAVRPAA